jgi:hypothetical protein
LKLFFISVIILAGVVLFVFALFPSEVSVTRVVPIHAPKDSVIRSIADLRSWVRWNELTRRTAGGSRQPAADSLQIRSGRLTVYRAASAADSVVTRWQDPSGRSFTGIFRVSGSGPETVLEWKLVFHLRWYPWEKMASMLYERQLGPLMDQSLLNLQQALGPLKVSLSRLSLPGFQFYSTKKIAS